MVYCSTLNQIIKILVLFCLAPHEIYCFDTLHCAKFSGHLCKAKQHSEISCHYWWPKMRNNIAKWCKAYVYYLCYMATRTSSKAATHTNFSSRTI